MQRWLLALLAALPLLAAPRGANLLADPGFEAPAAWSPYGEGFSVDEAVSRSGHRSIRCASQTDNRILGAKQVVVFDPPVKHPILFGGYSRAEGAAAGQDYNVYLDVHYDDGTPLWGQKAVFSEGSHGWERAEASFEPSKPIKSIEVFVLFRRATGTVWFDDIELSLAPFALRDLRLMPGLFGGASLAATATTTLPARWKLALTSPGGTLAESSGEGGPLRLLWASPTVPQGPLRLQGSAVDSYQGEQLRVDQPVELPRLEPSRGYAAWVESSMARVGPTALPRGELMDEARLELAGGEAESCQILLLPAPGRELRNIAVEATELVGSKAVLPASALEWHQVGYVRLEQLRGHPAEPEATPGWWPDALLPVTRFTVPAGFAQSIWLTVTAPRGTPSGDYQARVTLQPEGAAALDLPLTVTVQPFDLPVRPRLKTAFALMDGYLERLYGKPLATSMRQAYGDFVLRHRLNPDDISRTSPPELDDLRRYDAALNAFNVLNMVEERGERTWVCWSPLSVYTPAFKQRLIERLDPYVARLRQAGLADRGYVYTFDEREEDFYPVMREYFGLIKERYPELKTFTTAKVPLDPEIMRDLKIDWNCPLTARYRYDQAERCRAAGLQVWAYVCMGPGYPYANCLADHPLIETRLLGWQAYQQQMDGLLYWGLNIWARQHNDRPIDPAAGPLLDFSITTGAPGSEWDRLHGDGILLYPGVDGPIGSVRLAALRDGLDDYDYLAMLADLGGGREIGRQACLPVTSSLTHFSRDPAVLAAQRRAVAAQIRQLAGRR